MKEQVFAETLRAFAQRMPFKPFLVELISGAQLTIQHPEALVYRGRGAIHIDPEGHFTIFDNEGATRVCEIKNGSAIAEPPE